MSRIYQLHFPSCRIYQLHFPTFAIIDDGTDTGSIESVPVIITSFLVHHKGSSIILVLKERKPAGDEESVGSSISTHIHTHNECTQWVPHL